MKRIIIICEGQTEQEFIKATMQHYFASKGIYLQTPLIKASRGGIVNWNKLKQEVETHLKTDKTAIVTTLIDYYGLYTKHSFPNWSICEAIANKVDRMVALETAMSNDIDETYRHRFIPYLQLHEFEGLLFNDINIIYSQVPPADIVNEAELVKTFAQYDNPEMINNIRTTSPSHRLQRIIKGYNKVVYGSILSEAIGLERMRAKSPRFNEWVTKLEYI